MRTTSRAYQYSRGEQRKRSRQKKEEGDMRKEHLSTKVKSQGNENLKSYVTEDSKHFREV